jgi:hypothetical protein
LNIWHAIDSLEDQRNKEYPEKHAALLASMDNPLEELLALHSEALKARKSPFDVEIAMMVCMFLLVIGLCFQLDYLVHNIPTPLTVGVAVAEALALAALGRIFFPKGSARMQEKAARWDKRLATIDRIMKPMFADVDNIGVLLDRVGKSPWISTRTGYLPLDKKPRAAIIHLMPHICAGHAHQFNPARLNTLARFLRNGNEQIVTNALFAMAAVGDRGTMAQIARFAKRTPTNEEQERVQRVAQDCLAALALRLEHQKEALTLLHPSQPDAKQSLLRPAKGTDDPDPELLLRSTSEEP